MADFIEIIEDGEHITSKMPPDETIVEVKLKDGTICPAWYSQNIQEAGDWDFVPIEPGTSEPDLMADSLAKDVVAWRALPGSADEIEKWLKEQGAVESRTFDEETGEAMRTFTIKL